MSFGVFFVLVSEDESYNEAAQTLLTIGNMAHLSQSAQNLATDIQDHTTGKRHRFLVVEVDFICFILNYTKLEMCLCLLMQRRQ